jgi:hypothetical protein
MMMGMGNDMVWFNCFNAEWQCCEMSNPIASVDVRDEVVSRSGCLLYLLIFHPTRTSSLPS